MDWGHRAFRYGSSLLACFVLSCAGDEPPDGSDPDPEHPSPPWPLPRTCVPPEGLGAPSTIEELVTLVNALPKPTSLPCLLESLDRPLSLYASTSVASAQPATGPENPRIFLFRGALTMSVILEGPASHTLELAYAIGDRRSIKAELSFPVSDVLPPSAPYDQIRFGNGTGCGFCHGAETRVDSITFATAWSSDAFQDEPEQALPLSFVRQNAIDCDHELEAEARRCAMLDAIFGHGDVEPGDLARDSLVCHPF